MNEIKYKNNKFNLKAYSHKELILHCNDGAQTKLCMAVIIKVLLAIAWCAIIKALSYRAVEGPAICRADTHLSQTNQTC